MHKINPRINIMLLQDIHGIDVILLRSEVHKGVIGFASVGLKAPGSTIAPLRQSLFSNEVVFVQEFFQAFRTTSNCFHCSVPTKLILHLNRHFVVDKVPEHEIHQKLGNANTV